MGLGMKNVLNIAVFGLSLNSLEQIKEQILLSLPENLNVRWVNLAEQKIDLLLGSVENYRELIKLAHS